MAKFCSFCGSALVEGKTCACRELVTSNVASQQPQQFQQQTQQYQQQPQQYQQQPLQYQQQAQQQAYVVIAKENEFGKFCKNMFELFKNFMKSPSSMIKLVGKNQDFKAGMFFGLIQSILASFTIILFIKQEVGIFINLSAFGHLLSFGGYDIPYVSIFFKTFGFMLVQFFLLAGIIFGISKIFKGGDSFKGLMGVIGVASIPISIALLASMLFVFIYPSLIVCLILFGFFMSLFAGVVGVAEALQIDENKITYVIAISYVGYYMIIFLTVFNKSKQSLSGLF